MLHDPATYCNPEAFRPERHFEVYGEDPQKSEIEMPLDPSRVAFGFGRR